MGVPAPCAPGPAGLGVAEVTVRASAHRGDEERESRKTYTLHVKRTTDLSDRETAEFGTTGPTSQATVCPCDRLKPVP